MPTDNAEKAKLTAIFKKFDKDASGTLTTDEITEALREFNPSFDSSKFDISDIDANGNKTIDYTEFIAAAMKASAYTEEARLKEAFTHFDRNQDGTIDKKELFNGMTNYDMTMTEKDTDEIFDKIDIDKN